MEHVGYGGLPVGIRIVVIEPAFERGLRVKDILLPQDTVLAEPYIYIGKPGRRNDLLYDTLINITLDLIRRTPLDHEFRQFAIFHDGIARFVGSLTNQNSTFALIRH